ncbi:MAG: hypothetical protein A2015_13690 [Spirochaetes bacterium GWF1_31_7]|nr:MAG: hypothetical protein A2Y30_11135 [Spirochaetes bacterium GWE1_32_154]OHD47710.1 MAG: hypothetical protein A2Y29_05105 [Spirochaetes bacterium GWE2_31_10]OHD49871.1 MAG: hypothetical protein A2015_13690 [Spirochaetes bacterium GWF1_31_7]OHD82159.1 MAG: hypothetical protein A2355_13770 [Spirochaetes bacterium RIFOXYB1_FULL_32_8]
MSKNYKPLLFYVMFLFLTILLIVIFKFNQFLRCTYSILGFLGIFFFLFIVFIFDRLFRNSERNELNKHLYDTLLGGDRSLIFNFIISVTGSFSEELFFRVFLFSLLHIVIGLNAYVTIAIISILFGVMHFTQGKLVFILSLLSSIYFFLLMIITKSFVYPAIAHTLLNFIELELIRIEKNKKKPA